MQLIPREAEYARLLIGLTISILYFGLLLNQRPYKRDDIDNFSAILQVMLVLLFTASQSVYLYRQLQYYYEDDSTQKVIGFRSMDEVVAMMIVFNLSVLIVFLVMMVYQASAQRTVGILRLASSDQPPELTLKNKMHYHLFLSHVRCEHLNSESPPSH